MQKELRNISHWLLVIGVLALVSCTKREGARREQAPLRVETMVVTPQSNDLSTRYVGTVSAVRETPMSMLTPGRIEALYCRDGQRVHKGQVILRIDDTQAKNALKSAEALLRQAEDGFNRVQQVHAKGAVTDQKMVEIESELSRARSIYDAAQQQLNECTLKAPCEGVISGMTLEIGQSIVPGMKLFSILELSALNVRFTVPEAEIGKIAVSHSSEVSGEMECVALDTVLPIRITEKSVSASPITHTYEVTARILGGSDILLPGMIGKVRVQNTDRSADRIQTGNIIIPAHCILLKPEGPTVWLVEEGKAQRRNIVIDGYRADGVLVKSGLQAGDRLITEGYQKLYLGCPVIEE